MSKEDIAREKVKEMARLTMLTDRISSVQEKNLKLYPFVFFEAVSKVEIHYNLSNSLGVSTEENEKTAEVSYRMSPYDTKNLLVSYRITLDERLNGHLPKRFQAIEDSVRNLFWKQVRVQVFLNENLAYESKNV